MKNVEIKAKVDNFDEIEAIAARLSDTKKVVILQNDTFFNVTNHETGRLKLRQFEDGSGELIFYDRPNIKGLKLSNYEKTTLNNEACKTVQNMLTLSNGILGKVEKVRHLYMIGQTRIHIDKVNNLGSFLEFEIVLSDEDDIAVGEQISKDLMGKLKIKDDNLISGAYLDLLLNK